MSAKPSGVRWSPRGTHEDRRVLGPLFLVDILARYLLHLFRHSLDAQPLLSTLYGFSKFCRCGVLSLRCSVAAVSLALLVQRGMSAADVAGCCKTPGAPLNARLQHIMSASHVLAGLGQRIGLKSHLSRWKPFSSRAMLRQLT